MKINKKQKKTICFLIQKLRNMSENWAITGSFGQVLQGIDIIPDDIDIISTKKGVGEIQSILEEFIIQEVCYTSISSMRSYFGVLEMNSCRIEFFGEIENLLTNNYWEPHIGWEENITKIIMGTTPVPVLTLEYELLVCKKIFYTERATLIEKKLSAKSHIG
jgi:hypothetical protein